MTQITTEMKRWVDIGQTDRQTDRQTERDMDRPNCHSTQCMTLHTSTVKTHLQGIKTTHYITYI